MIAVWWGFSTWVRRTKIVAKKPLHSQWWWAGGHMALQHSLCADLKSSSKPIGYVASSGNGSMVSISSLRAREAHAVNEGRDREACSSTFAFPGKEHVVLEWKSRDLWVRITAVTMGGPLSLKHCYRACANTCTSRIDKVQVTMVRARNLHNTDLGWIDKSDPYCQCEIPGLHISDMFDESISCSFAGTRAGLINSAHQKALQWALTTPRPTPRAALRDLRHVRWRSECGWICLVCFLLEWPPLAVSSFFFPSSPSSSN